MKLWCATTNRGKLLEFRLAGGDVEALPNMSSIPPSPEDGETFEANAAQKAVYYSRYAEGLLFADDSGLEVDALNGEPGVRSARFAGEGATDAANNALLLRKLAAAANRRARFVCVIALAQAGQVVRTFRGAMEGEILMEPRGSGGFGYDPLFYYPPLGQTLAEIPPERKFAVSHRGQAFRELIQWVRTECG